MSRFSPDNLAVGFYTLEKELAASRPGQEETVDICLAETQESEAIASLIISSFRRAESFFIDGDRIDVDTVRTFMEKGKFLVARDDKHILTGCVYVELRGERAYLGLLSVDPARQKSGLGSTLMQAAESYCAKAGCRFIDLQIVNVRRELPDFYRKRGYVESGTAPFPSGLHTKVPCHFVKMSKPLL